MKKWLNLFYLPLALLCVIRIKLAKEKSTMKSWVCRHTEGLVFCGYLLAIATFILFEEGLLP